MSNSKEISIVFWIERVESDTDETLDETVSKLIYQFRDMDGIEDATVPPAPSGHGSLSTEAFTIGALILTLAPIVLEVTLPRIYGLLDQNRRKVARIELKCGEDIITIDKVDINDVAKVYDSLRATIDKLNC